MMEGSWQDFGIAFIRCIGFLSILPFPGGLSGISIKTAGALALSLFFASFPGTQPPCSLSNMLVEFLVGLMLSIPVMLVIAAASAVGELMDAVRGQTIGTLYDASSSAPVSITNGIIHSYSWVMVLLQGGFEESIRLLAHSFQVMPSGLIALRDMESLGIFFINLTVYSLRGCLAWVAPFALCCFLVEICFGLVSRVSPGISLQGESFQLKSLLGLVALYALSTFELQPACLQLLSLLQSALSTI